MIPCPNAYDILLRTIMDPVDRAALESYIGYICLGDYGSVPKYVVLYGEPGSGKSTILNFLVRIFGEGRVSYSPEMAKIAKSKIVIIQDGDTDKIIEKTFDDLKLMETTFFIATNKLPKNTDILARTLCMTGKRIAEPIFRDMFLPGLWEMTIPYKYYCVDKLYRHLNNDMHE